MRGLACVHLVNTSANALAKGLAHMPKPVEDGEADLEVHADALLCSVDTFLRALDLPTRVLTYSALKLDNEGAREVACE